MRKLLIPEVVQTSSLDCGPAALKALLEGFGRPVSYGRLREACQTGLDGTSIETIEAVANQLGLEAEQIMLPVDHLLMPEAHALPAVVVVTLPQGLTHFVVVWRRLGRWLQVMDPAAGRRWIHQDRFLPDIYRHTMSVAAGDWCAYASSDEFQLVLNARQRSVGIHSIAIRSEDWRALAAYDAAVRLAQSLVKSGAVLKGAEAEQVLTSFVRQPGLIPDDYWSVSAGDVDEDGNQQVRTRGAVLVRVKSRRALPSDQLSEELAAALHEKPLSPARELVRFVLGSAKGADARRQSEEEFRKPLGGEPRTAAVLRAFFRSAKGADARRQSEEEFRKPLGGEPRTAAVLRAFFRSAKGADARRQSEEEFRKPLGGEPRTAAVLRAFPASGYLLWPLLLLAIGAAGCGAFLEALLFRGLLDMNSTLALAGQRLAASAAVTIFCTVLLLLELASFATGVRLGRILENRLRVIFLDKLPKLSDRYFQSRPVSDMAERSHILHRLRHLPDQLRQLMLAVVQLVTTAIGVVWLEPRAWPLMLASLCAALIPVLSAHWLLAERDLRVRTHSGGLMRFYLDAMLGIVAIRTHGAANSLRRQHGGLLKEWTTASFRLQRAVVMTEALQLCIMFGLVAALLLNHPFSSLEVGRVLLLAYWALNMPALGQEIATVARQYPNYRSIVLRLLEPLRASEEVSSGIAEPLLEAPMIDYRNVGVTASGNTILSNVSVNLEAGAHVAIVGPSGAGKSTLAGLLLGWLKPSCGQILVNGRPLDAEQLRVSSAWVDPAVQIWNRSLQSNLGYGGDEHADLGNAIDAASLRHVLENLPQGLQTKLGENGGLVSGGEGQRVRFARALQRRSAKLVILDEPFRGLDRDKRSQLLARAREYWSQATLLCITHDLSETRNFDRVLVVERGTVVENGSPGALASNAASRYSQLLAAEENARRKLWESTEWRRIRLHSGRILEELSRPLNAEARESEVA